MLSTRRIGSALVLVLVLVLDLVLASTARADDAVRLEWRWAAGDRLRYRMSHEQRQRMLAAKPLEMGVRQTLVFGATVTAVAADGAATLALTFEAVKVSADRPGGGHVTYDSTNPEDEGRREHPAVRPIACFLAQTVTLTVDRLGAVREARGFDAISSRALEGFDGPGPPGMADQLRETFGDEAMRRQLEALFRVVPDHAVPVGASWTAESERSVPGLGRIAFDNAFTLRALEPADGGPLARIGVATRLTFHPPAPGGPRGPMGDVSLRDAASSGEVVFSAGAGRIVRSATEASMTLHLEPKGPPPGGETAPEFRLEAKGTLELVAPNAPAF